MVTTKQLQRNSTAPFITSWFFFLTLIFISANIKAEAPAFNIFLDLDNNETSVLEPVNENIVIRERAVLVETQAIKKSFGVLYLNLFNDVDITAIRDRVEEIDSESFAWIGHVDGIENSEITLVIDGDGLGLSGAIKFAEFYFHIRPLESGHHVIREIDFSAFETDENIAPLATEPSDNPTIDENQAFPSDMLVVEESLAYLVESSDLVPFEQEVLNLVNEERTIRNLGTLTEDSKLTSAARSHSQDMAQQGYFSHTGLDGRSPFQRITATGYQYNSAGENIAFGYQSPQAVMNGWINSSGHKANILGSNFCDIGIGYAANGHYWTQSFGRKQGLSQCPASTPNAPDTPVTPNPPNDPEPNTPGELRSGQTQSFTLGRNETKAYTIQVPENATNLKASISGSGDADLYVKRARVAWPGDAGPHNDSEFKALWVTGSDETVTFTNPGSGSWHVFLHGYSQAQGNIIITYE
ncbi:MAG: CAP domain-containing protein [Methylococcales bacterium]